MQTLCLIAGYCLLTTNTYGQGSLKDLEDYQQATSQVHTCGTINEANLESLSQNGIATVISLSTESPSKIILHKAKAKTLGMTFIHIPVSWKKPTLTSLEYFFNSMDNHQEDEILVHCKQNWRASAFVYLYRTLRLKEDDSKAKEAMLKVWNPQRHANWSRFIAEAQKYFAIKP